MAPYGAAQATLLDLGWQPATATEWRRPFRGGWELRRFPDPSPEERGQEDETFLTYQIISLFHKCKGGDDWGSITENDLDDRLGDPDMAKEWKNINVRAAEATYVFALFGHDAVDLR